MNALWSTASLMTANLIRTRGPRSGSESGSSIYLTFDDGPHPVHTPHLLSVLERHGAKGTFFLIGQKAEKHPQVVRRILDGGHAIGNHSMRHPKMRALPRSAQWAEIDLADVVLARFDGRRRHAFRPPNGRVTAWAVASSIWRRQPLVLWTIDSLDYKLSADAVAHALRERKLVDGDVILFHDDAARAAEALDALLPAWLADGYTFPPTA